MKKATVSAVLVAIFATSLVFPTNAFFNPGNPPSDDNMYNNFGPVTQNLVITPYPSQLDEYYDYLSGNIDFMDASLTADQMAYLNYLDPNMNTYARALFSFSGDYGAYRRGWENVVNEWGNGPWSWYTFLNTYNLGADTVRWGFANDMTGLNVVTSTSHEDRNLLNLVYDRLAGLSPYDYWQDIPLLAQSWVFGEYLYEDSPATVIEFKLREDVYWHDIAPKDDRQTPNGVSLLPDGAVNVQFKAADVAFSIMAIKNAPDAWGNIYTQFLVGCSVIDPFTVRVYFNMLDPFITYHEITCIPIMPMHVWKPLFDEGTYAQFDAFAQEAVAGTGPWVLDYDASTVGTLYVLHANTRFFRYHPVDITMDMSNYKVAQPGSTIGPIQVIAHNMDTQRETIPGGTFSLTVSYTDPNGAVTTVFTGSIDTPLDYCVPTVIYTIEAVQVDRGLHTWTALISADPSTGHTDQDGYSEFVWSTIPEDITLNFVVNGADCVLLGMAFGSSPGLANWDGRADINRDGYVNAKDAVKEGAVFGWPNL